MTRCCDFVYKHRTGNLVLTHMPSIKMTAHISSSTKSYSETHCTSMESLPVCLCDTSPCWLRLIYYYYYFTLPTTVHLLSHHHDSLSHWELGCCSVGSSPRRSSAEELFIDQPRWCDHSPITFSHLLSAREGWCTISTFFPLWFLCHPANGTSTSPLDFEEKHSIIFSQLCILHLCNT